MYKDSPREGPPRAHKEPGLWPTSYGREHRFPEKRHVRRVIAARSSYKCDMMGNPPPGHVGLIGAGEKYCRVQLKPDKRIHAGWRTRRFCRSCAIHLGLATEDRP